ncbi:hypothetical protein MNB_SV-5-1274 [hydrothermal vent metagenome]|uniref:DUF4412 domain-containing protein n=1 Tax=hydrothermal vent metagenome TaxID=652676 RepID=A0A1W1EDR7_9ZZZZ
MTKKILLATGLLTSMLLADFTLEYKIEGNMKQLVQYKDAKHVLIMTDSEDGMSGGQLLIDDKKFMVMKQGGKTKYMDMDVMMEQMKGMGQMFGEASKSEMETPAAPAFKVIKKGKKVKTAGVDAQIWTVEVEEEGKKERMDVVVTDNKDVVAAIEKYTDVMKQFTQMGAEEDDALSALFNIAKGYAVISFDGMKLVSYDDANIPDSVYALPAGMNVGKKLNDKNVVATVKKPPLCPIVGSHGKAKQLDAMLKDSADGWKKIESATCMNMMKMRIENAIYQKGDSYIHINLSVNVEDEKGIVATYRTNNMEISDHKKGKIQGKRYQSAYLKRAKQNAMDIRLDNAMLTMSSTGSEKPDMASFADNVFDLSKFRPVKKSKPTADEALKSLGGMFGAGASQSGGNAKDAKAAEEMLKGLFGK